MTRPASLAVSALLAGLLGSTSALAQEALHGNTPLEGLATTGGAAAGFDRMFPLGNASMMAVDSDGRPLLNPYNGRVRNVSTYIIPQSSTVSALRALGSQVPHDCPGSGMSGAQMSLIDPKPDAAPAEYCGQPGDSEIPAGFTFLGQFVDHDITLDVVTQFDSPANVGAVGNTRTPNLDLDCIYGDGPEAWPFLYEDGVKLRVGAPIGEGRHDLMRVPGGGTAIIGDPRNDENLVVSQLQAGFIAVHNAFVDELVHAHWEELLNGADTLMALFAGALSDPGGNERPSARVLAAPAAEPAPAPEAAMLDMPGKCSPMRIRQTVEDIGDDRFLIDRENIDATFDLIRSFCDDPNAEITLLSGAEKREIFEEARAHTIHYYHRALLEDFLPHVIGNDKVQQLRANGRRFFLREGLFDQGEGLRQPNMPIEFSVAAYRYGHSQVRNFYRLRDGHSVPLFAISTPENPVPQSMLGFHPLGEDDRIDWKQFFNDGGDSYGGNCTRLLDHQLAEVLYRLPFAGGSGSRCEIPAAESSLAARNLNRGRVYRLPSGESIRRALDTPNKLFGDPAAPFAGLDNEDAVNKHFAGTGDTPLWLYILLEARGHKAAMGDDGLPSSADGGTGGQVLGPVGGLIVGETMLGLLDYYREQTGEGLDFIPSVGIWELDAQTPAPERVTVLDLLTFAGQVPSAE